MTVENATTTHCRDVAAKFCDKSSSFGRAPLAAGRRRPLASPPPSTMGSRYAAPALLVVAAALTRRGAAVPQLVAGANDASAPLDGLGHMMSPSGHVIGRCQTTLSVDVQPNSASSLIVQTVEL